MSRKGLNSTDFTQRNSGGGARNHLDDWDYFDKRKSAGGLSDPIEFDRKFAAKSGDLGGGVYKTASCFESHPAMPLPGTSLVIYGGSCSRPIVKDADIYIGFDHSMSETKRRFPWNNGEEVRFLIPDMSTPSDPDEFRRLVIWTKKKIAKGAKIHAGCIGGHGRTGMFLSALVSLYGEKGAIDYVRQHYCQKAVESSGQVNFLSDQFGITKAKGAKSYTMTEPVTSIKKPRATGAKAKGKGKGNLSPDLFGKGVERFAPIAGNGEVWR